MDSNSLVFLIGLGLGLGVAAGIRPYLPALLAGVLASASVLGVRFAPGGYRFLAASWWLLAIAVVLVLAYAVQFRAGSKLLESSAPAAALAALGAAVGALLFAGTLAARGEPWWPGLIGGAAAALLATGCLRPFVLRVRSRLDDVTAREAVSVYLDLLALLVAAVSAALPPLGYVAVVLVVWFGLAGRRRSAGRYAGLRILGRE
ncbi:MAG: DUF4126 family protein [Solirubrobacteraceae bacterium]